MGCIKYLLLCGSVTLAKIHDQQGNSIHHSDIFVSLPGSLAVLAAPPVKRSYIERAAGRLLLTRVERL